jgi:ADP-ribose pyrophosphatase YjhB (NUDIX family)
MSGNGFPFGSENAGKTMEPSQIFQYCPRCGAKRKQLGAPLECAACGFLYYFNPCAAVAGFVLNSRGEALFLRRAKEPAKGKLAVPGGFIDIGERAEDALCRETREEVGLELTGLQFLCSQLNSYHYKDVTYPVLDLFFVARAKNPEAAQPLDGVESLIWMKPESVNPDEIAFPSIRAGLAAFREAQNEDRLGGVSWG